MNKEQDSSFQSSYGTQTANGKYQTLKEMRSGSFLTQLQTTFKMTIFIVMLIGCFWCIYSIDIKGDSKDVMDAAKKAANISLQEIYDDTINAGHEIKKGVQKKIDEAGESIHQLDDKYHISSTIKAKYDSLKNKVKELISPHQDVQADQISQTIKEKYNALKNKVKEILSSHQDSQSDSDTRKHKKGQKLNIIQRLQDKIEHVAQKINEHGKKQKQTISQIYNQDQI